MNATLGDFLFVGLLTLIGLSVGANIGLTAANRSLRRSRDFYARLYLRGLYNRRPHA